jgi:hypothetical protein
MDISGIKEIWVANGLMSSIGRKNKPIECSEPMCLGLAHFLKPVDSLLSL